MTSISLFFAILQMISDGTSAPHHGGTSLCLAACKAPRRCPHTLAGEMDLSEGSTCDWKGVRVSLLVEDEVNIHDFVVVVLINKAHLGDKRPKAEGDGGGESQ